MPETAARIVQPILWLTGNNCNGVIAVLLDVYGGCYVYGLYAVATACVVWLGLWPWRMLKL